MHLPTLTPLRFGAIYRAEDSHTADNFQRARVHQGYQDRSEADFPEFFRLQQEHKGDRLEFLSQPLPELNLSNLEGPSVTRLHSYGLGGLGIRRKDQGPFEMSRAYDLVVVNKDAQSKEALEAHQINAEASRLHEFQTGVFQGQFDELLTAHGIEAPLDPNPREMHGRRLELYDKIVKPQIDALQARIDKLVDKSRPVPPEFANHVINVRLKDGRVEALAGMPHQLLEKLRELGYSNPEEALREKMGIETGQRTEAEMKRLTDYRKPAWMKQVATKQSGDVSLKDILGKADSNP